MSRKAPVAATVSKLNQYRAMWDFSRTPEPEGACGGTTASAAGNGFVVQKHAATRLHYDFRLELDGVLISWAVARGSSANPSDKRLAVCTKDHPLEYARFEGSIPAREYGGGTVMLWDSGSWEPMPGKDPRQTLIDGHLHFILDGRRMRGEWIMIRLKPRLGEKRENWLLRKVADAFAAGWDDLTGLHLTSIDSGRTLEEIAAGKAPPMRKTAANPSPSVPPPFRPLQLAKLSDHVSPGDKWLHEMKLDGYDTLIAIGGGEGRAYTRSGLDWSERFAGLIADAVTLDVGSALIDGEAVVMMDDGRTSFQALQAAVKNAPGRIDYFAFDLLMIDGEDLTEQPLTERKKRLAALIDAGAGHIRYSDHIAGQGEKLFD